MSRPNERIKIFQRWPKYYEQYMRVLENLIDLRTDAGKDGWTRENGTTAEEIMRWWLEDKNLDGQISLFENSLDGRDNL